MTGSSQCRSDSPTANHGLRWPASAKLYWEIADKHREETGFKSIILKEVPCEAADEANKWQLSSKTLNA